MVNIFKAGIVVIFSFWVICLSDPVSADLEEFSESELSFIRSHGPWPPIFVAESSNRLSGKVEAIALGKRLFHDPRLSRDGSVSCATCHVPDKNFIDGLDTAIGFEKGIRNTPSLNNLAFHRWYGWGGGSDSLWMQNIRPILSPIEMDGGQRIGPLIQQDIEYAKSFISYLQLQGMNSTGSNLISEQSLVWAAKNMAAYLETAITSVTAFDRFRVALLEDNEISKLYPASARRGLKLFVGRGRCSVCHYGPMFTNGEFAEIGIPYFVPGGVDKGRFDGINKVKNSDFNLLGKYNDSAEMSNSDKTRFLKKRHDSFGQFRIPSLRGVSQTAPYMHNGSLANLEQVMEHYSHIDLDRLHTDGESILKRLNLTDMEVRDLISFLATLTEE